MTKIVRRSLAVCLFCFLLILSACSPDEAETVNGDSAPTPYVPVDGQAPERGVSVPRGVIDGSSYTSGFVGVSFTLPDEGWAFATPETLANMMLVDPALLESAEFDFDEAGTVILHDMVANHLEGESNVAVMVEDLYFSEGGADITAEQFLVRISEQLTGAGMDMFEFTFGEIEEVEIGGHGFALISADVVMEALGINSQQHYIARRNGDFMIVIVVSLSDDVSFEEIFTAFS